MASPLQRLLDYLVTTYRRTANSLRVSWSRSIHLVGLHRPALITFEVTYHALILSAMLAAIYRPSLQAASLARVHDQLEAYQMGRSTVAAYEGRRFFRAALATFGINLGVGAFGTISLPSLLVPFSGLLLTAYRAAEWGLIFAPVKGPPEWPHMLTLVVEGQAYVLAALASWVQSRAFLRGLQRERERKEQGLSWSWSGVWTAWKESWSASSALYLPITAVLAVSAVWEAYEVIYLLPNKMP